MTWTSLCIGAALLLTSEPGSSTVAESGVVSRRVPQANRRYHTYAEARKALQKTRKKLYRMYRKAESRAERKKVLKKAGGALAEGIDRGLFPFWYGTPWTMNGTTTTPGKGKICCGYFVSTILEHSGFRVRRARLGQQPSMYIIRTMVRRRFIKGTSDWSMQRFVKMVRRMGDGLYIIGLDCHVGFLLVENGKVYFVHASYGTPPVVVKEPAFSSAILASSSYRKVGRLTADPLMLIRWLYRARFTTKVYEEK
jgi:hypothetical protein